MWIFCSWACYRELFAEGKRHGRVLQVLVLSLIEIFIALLISGNMDPIPIVIMTCLMFLMSVWNAFPKTMNTFLMLFLFFYTTLNFFVNSLDFFWNGLYKEIEYN